MRSGWPEPDVLRRLAVVLVLGAVVPGACGDASADAPSGAPAPNPSQIDESAARAADLLRKQNQDRDAGQQVRKLREKAPRPAAPGRGADHGGDDWSGRRFDVREIRIDNDEPTPAVEAIFSRYRNRRLGANEMVALVRELDDLYSARGFVTTIVSIPPQNLLQGRLRLHVEWGRIRRVLLNGRRVDALGLRERLEVGSAMPGLAGSVLNIHSIDQLVDNLSTGAKTVQVKILPTQQIDESDVDIESSPGTGRVQSVLGVDNSGSSLPDGHYRSSLQVSIADLLGINDRLQLSAGYRFFQHRDGNEENSLGFSYSVPVGFWSADIAYSAIDTRTPYPTVYGTYYGKGTLQQSSVKLSRLLSRDATHITNAWTQVLVRNNASYFEGQLIDISSKSYTQFSLGLTDTRSFDASSLYSELAWARGVPWLSGDVTPSSNDGPTARYDLLRGTLIWQHRRAADKALPIPLLYTARGAFQWSDNPLLGLDKFMFGDQYTVRGYKSDPFSGDKGVYVSTDVATARQLLPGLQASPHLGLDAGTSKNNDNPAGWTWTVAAAAGVDLSWKGGSLSLVVGAPLTRNIAVSAKPVLHAILSVVLD